MLHSSLWGEQIIIHKGMINSLSPHPAGLVFHARAHRGKHQTSAPVQLRVPSLIRATLRDLAKIKKGKVLKAKRRVISPCWYWAPSRRGAACGQSIF